MWILLASYPNLTHVNQTMRELLTNMELGPKDLRKIIYIQCFTEAQGTDGPKISLAKLLGASATLTTKASTDLCWQCWMGGRGTQEMEEPAVNPASVLVSPDCPLSMQGGT